MATNDACFWPLLFADLWCTCTETLFWFVFSYALHSNVDRHTVRKSFVLFILLVFPSTIYFVYIFVTITIAHFLSLSCETWARPPFYSIFRFTNSQHDRLWSQQHHLVVLPPSPIVGPVRFINNTRFWQPENVQAAFVVASSSSSSSSSCSSSASSSLPCPLSWHRSNSPKSGKSASVINPWKRHSMARHLESGSSHGPDLPLSLSSLFIVLCSQLGIGRFK